MNYFIEGIQGAGKSTLVGKLSEMKPDHKVFREGDYNPVELAWCAYVREEKYREILEKYASIRSEIEEKSHAEDDHMVICYTQILTDIPGFHKDLEQYEIYNARVGREEFENIILSRYSNWDGENQIFECSLLQNIVENQILYFEMQDEEIIAFYKKIADILAQKQYQILYLDTDDVAGSLEVIRKERVDEKGNEIWYQMMLQFLESCPYGKDHGFNGFDDLVAHLEHRKTLEKRILNEVFSEHAVILKSKDYDLAIDLITKDQWAALFNDIHPGYFERDYVKRVADDEPASEMFLGLIGFNEHSYEKSFPENITFGYYNGDFKELLTAVEKVIPHWVPLFSEKSRVYCGFVDGKIASFCMIENFGEHILSGKKIKIGGPGCVGTVPEYRDRGIGLTMVRNVTEILKDEGYDLSYIHYTYETGWYSKLGYKVVLSWTGKGII